VYHKLARQLRKNTTDSERRLWQELRRCQVDGFKFRRQAPIGNYVVDFVCFERTLVIELDGGQHAEQLEFDNSRTDWLNKEGFRVLRFWNNQVFAELEGVMEIIWRALRDTPHPNPPPQGGRGQVADGS
jgi:very-short-patch-repair endonuclease